MAKLWTGLEMRFRVAWGQFGTLTLGVADLGQEADPWLANCQKPWS
ncbi:MAG: hypothetical protein HN742_16220 [Lentisphaerae bacterium]|nr:hypothetical protein [Lentisphaerota bacterium]MBT4817390.1 hypothetical protein [Lentisphaerota bacterium]MBT5612168.1 hypothetical protein [Lentisphaerota bacterium]MBT7061095.1 hypothetical protein [Lentisphaerota bacterium]MBT7843424.1 hypothetical protein [Lentisphaerota bacterium]